MNVKTAILSALIVPALLLGGCTSPAKKKMEAISRGVYAAKASMDAGRFDLAKKYNAEVTRLVAPPKKKTKVNKFEVVQINTNSEGIFTKGDLIQNTQDYVVLPEGFEAKPVIVENSKEFNKILAENADLLKKEEENGKNLERFVEQTEKVIRKQEEEVTKEKKSGWLGWLMGFGTLGIAVGAGVLCIAFPALIPLITRVFGLCRSLVNRGVELITNLFKKNTP